MLPIILEHPGNIRLANSEEKIRAEIVLRGLQILTLSY